MFKPTALLFEWLEGHTQIRLSILLGYLFGKSPLFLSLVKSLSTATALVSQALRPMADGLRAAIAPLVQAVALLSRQVMII